MKKKNKKDLLRRAAIERKLKRLVKRPEFSPQDRPDVIESQYPKGLLQRELSEDEAYEITLDNHPDLKAMERMGTLPEELLDENIGIWNPRMHLTLHAAIEQQLASNEPKGIVEMAIRFEREKKLCAHEIKHVIIAALTEQVWTMQHDNVPFDEKLYFIDIEAAYHRWCKAYETNSDDHEGNK